MNQDHMSQSAANRQRGLRRTPLRRGKPLRNVSNKQARELAAYRVERDTYLAHNPWCHFPGCRNPSSELHHKAGRGTRLRVQRWWAASCREHNDFAETHTGEALACGWLLSYSNPDQEAAA